MSELTAEQKKKLTDIANCFKSGKISALQLARETNDCRKRGRADLNRLAELEQGGKVMGALARAL